MVDIRLSLNGGGNGQMVGEVAVLTMYHMGEWRSCRLGACVPQFSDKPMPNYKQFVNGGGGSDS